MPIHKEGSGEQWGNHGKVYHGPDAKKKAAAQAAAAHANGYTGDRTVSVDIDKVLRDTKPRDMDPAKFKELEGLLVEFFGEEAKEPEHQHNEAACDCDDCNKAGTRRTIRRVGDVRVHVHK